MKLLPTGFPRALFNMVAASLGELNLWGFPVDLCLDVVNNGVVVVVVVVVVVEVVVVLVVGGVVISGSSWLLLEGRTGAKRRGTGLRLLASEVFKMSSSASVDGTVDVLVADVVVLVVVDAGGLRILIFELPVACDGDGDVVGWLFSLGEKFSNFTGCLRCLLLFSFIPKSEFDTSSVSSESSSSGSPRGFSVGFLSLTVIDSLLSLSLSPFCFAIKSAFSSPAFLVSTEMISMSLVVRSFPTAFAMSDKM
jgi:hypothetical protein